MKKIFLSVFTQKTWVFYSARFIYRALISSKRFVEVAIEYTQFSSKKDERFRLSWSKRYLCLLDKTSDIDFDRHYIYHTSWAARRISESKVKKHIDISSSLQFVSALSAFIEVEHYDFRKPDLALSNLKVGQQDLCSLSLESNSIASLSCMHVLEHIGLGRYGDAIDPTGDLKATKELVRILSEGGILYLVVPISQKSIISFNAHRSYSPSLIEEMFKDLKLLEFSMIKNKTGGLLENASFSDADGEDYGCGMFIFTKSKS